MADSDSIRKNCVMCGVDVADRKRIKDPKGNYYCEPCYAARKKAVGKSGPLVANAGRSDEINSSMLNELVSDAQVSPASIPSQGQSYDLAAPKEGDKNVPSPAPVAAYPSSACPRCGAPLPPLAVLCVSCGLNMKTGRRLDTKLDSLFSKLIPKFSSHTYIFALLFTTILMFLIGWACSVNLWASLVCALIFLGISGIVALVATFWWALSGEHSDAIRWVMILWPISFLAIAVLVFFAITFWPPAIYIAKIVSFGFDLLSLCVPIILIYRLVTDWRAVSRPFLLWAQSVVIGLLAIAVPLYSINRTLNAEGSSLMSVLANPKAFFDARRAKAMAANNDIALTPSTVDQQTPMDTSFGAPPEFRPSGGGVETAQITAATSTHSVRVIRIYRPTTPHANHTLPCVFIAPAGTPLIYGSELGSGDLPEHLPYANAGLVVVAYSLDGPFDSQGHHTWGEVAQAVKAFEGAEGGITNARLAINYAIANVPDVDPNQLYTAGHSSAATIALDVAASDARIRGVLAYAPAPDATDRKNAAAMYSHLQPLVPDIMQFVQRVSPINHVREIHCPIFLFHADDDSNVTRPQIEAYENALVAAGVHVDYRTVAHGEHYQSMIDDGIPQGIAWLCHQAGLNSLASSNPPQPVPVPSISPPPTNPSIGAVTQPIVVPPPAPDKVVVSKLMLWHIDGWEPSIMGSDPLSAVCSLRLKRVFPKMTLYAGVDEGPEAASLEDPACADFVKKHRDFLTKNLPPHVAAVTTTRTQNGISFQQSFADNGDEIAEMLLGIQDHHCVAYWYVGNRYRLQEMLAETGKAQLTER